MLPVGWRLFVRPSFPCDQSGRYNSVRVADEFLNWYLAEDPVRATVDRNRGEVHTERGKA